VLIVPQMKEVLFGLKFVFSICRAEKQQNFNDFAGFPLGRKSTDAIG